jgi:hypothetical protein
LSYSERIYRQTSDALTTETPLSPVLTRLAVELKDMAKRTSGAELLVSQMIIDSPHITPAMMKNLQGLDMLRQLQEDAALLLHNIARLVNSNLHMEESDLELGLKLNDFACRVVRGVETAKAAETGSAHFFDDNQ